MTIAQQLADIAAAKEATRTAIVGKGGTLPAGSGLTAFPAAVDAIPSGGGGVDVTGVTNGTATVIDWSSAGDTGSIRNYAFYDCRNLTSLTLPHGMTGSIGTNAFRYCTTLTSLTLPPGLTGSIGTYAFRYCTALTSLVIQSQTMMTLSNTNAFTSTTCNIYVPDPLVDTYKGATNWSTLAARIKPISELP